MEDTIEVCSKCGKMPRAIDLVDGFFRCTRCGNNQLMTIDRFTEYVAGMLDYTLARDKEKKRPTPKC